MNAIIGDNGIITRAREANIQSSIANLEEYLQLKYTEHYEEMAQYKSKIEGLTNVCSNYFYIPAQEGIGSLRYVMDSEGHALYLIKKSGLPEEIKESLTGGDAGEGSYADYQSLNDVYGVTANLKVYYCSGGVDSIKGLAKESLDNNNPLRTVVKSSENSSLYDLLKSFDDDGNQELSAEEVKSIDSITITSEDNIKDLKEFYNFPSLKELYLESASLESFDGIENCAYLHLISCDKCVIPNYSAIGKLGKRLDTLYFYDLDDSELEKICSKDNSVGIGSYKLTGLENLAFSGTKSYINSDGIYETQYYTGDPIYLRKGKRECTKLITSLKCLENLDSDTKKSVKKLSVAFNNINSLSGLEGFENLYLLRAEGNLLNNLDGVGNCKNLEILNVVDNKLTMLTKFSEGSKLKQLGVAGNSSLTTFSGLENCSDLTYIFAMNCNIGYSLDDSNGKSLTDGLAALKNKKSLYWLELSNNSNIIWIDYIKNDQGIRYLRLTGCEAIDNSSIFDIKELFNHTDGKYYIPSKYSFALLNSSTKILDLSNQELEKESFLSLKDYTNLTHLSLKNLKIYEFGGDGTKKYLNSSGSNSINNLFNEVLSPLTNMSNLQLNGCSDLSTLSFLQNMNKLKELDVRNTGITDLSILENKRNDNTMDLYVLAVNTVGTNLSLIPNTISRMYENSGSEYWCLAQNTIEGGLLCDSKDVWNSLNGSSITELKVHAGGLTLPQGSGSVTIDLSSCGSLENLILNTGMNLKLPSSIKSINCMNAKCPVFSAGTNLTDIKVFRWTSFKRNFCTNIKYFFYKKIGWCLYIL